MSAIFSRLCIAGTLPLKRLCFCRVEYKTVNGSLVCRDAAKASPGLIHQTAYNINLALARVGVIKIVRVGDARPRGNASEFRYLLPL